MGSIVTTSASAKLQLSNNLEITTVANLLVSRGVYQGAATLSKCVLLNPGALLFTLPPLPGWHRVSVLRETSFFRSCVGLSVALTGLDFVRRFTDVLFVDPAKTFFE